MADPTPPQPGLLQAANQAGALWKKQSARRRTVLIVALLAVAGVVAFFYLKPVNTGWTAVLSRVAPEDAVELGAALDGKGIPHQFADAGATIEVPNERIGEARIVAQAAGLPHVGDGMELFDHQTMGQSSFTEQVNYRRALQGELARSITTLVQVDGARVQIALGRRSVLKDADERPSASVALRLRQGTTLTADEVRGIKQLVAASIEGMAPESVVVIDQHGVALNGDAKGGSNGSDDHSVELATAGRVRSMLEKIVGVGHVVVVASADIDTTQVSQTEELFDPAKIALRSESVNSDGSGVGAGTTSGVAGTQGNLNPTPASTTPGGPSGHSSETKNYEVSKVVRQTVGGGDRIHRMHLAVLIDDKVGADGKVIPRTPDELSQLTALAKTAGGLDDTRGDQIEMRAVQFAPEEPAAPEVAGKPAAKAFPIMLVAAGGGALLLIIIITVFVLRRGGKDETHTMVLPAPVSELERMLSSPNGSVPQLPGPRPVHARVVETVRADVPRAVGVLSGWLSPPAAPTSERS